MLAMAIAPATRSTLPPARLLVPARIIASPLVRSAAFARVPPTSPDRPGFRVRLIE
jgi:hypothetical protein